jgi:glycerol-3-phosphate acyltransferase PlsY
MTAWAVLAGTFLGAYLMGAIPFGYLVARYRGVDILRAGSGNIGATNIGRVLGWRCGILVFVLDFAKGAVPTAVAGTLASWPALDVARLPPEILPVAAGLAAFVGHLFPVYLRFRGGKGVATGAGVIAVLLPGPALVALLSWVVVVCIGRYVSLASIAAVVALCATRLLTPGPFATRNLTGTVFCLVAAALVVLRHRTNVARLLQGNENRLRNGGTMLTVTKIVHLLALGVWLGSVVFFTFGVGLPLFHAYQSLGTDVEHRPAWFPLARDFSRTDARIDGPTEQGTRAAGFAVGQLFGSYYLLQLVCAVFVVATALSWSASVPARVHAIRVLVVVVALITVVAGWTLERYVAGLQVVRNQAVDAVLQNTTGGRRAATIQFMGAAKVHFGIWHGVSLLVNLLTLGLVGAAMALASALPTRVEAQPTRSGPAVKGPGPATAVAAVTDSPAPPASRR